MKTKHTPGPWTCAKPTRLKQNYISSKSGPVAITSSSSEVSRETNLANARLIAAAPELLAALRQLVKDADDNAESLKVWYAAHPHLEAARAAINKAIGGAA